MLDERAAWSKALTFELSDEGGALQVFDLTPGRLYGIGWLSPLRGEAG